MASDNLVSITINDKSLRRSLRALDLAATDHGARDAQNRRNPAGGNTV